MRADPILDAFAHLVRRDAHAPLVASPRASASRGEVDALATVIASRLGSTGVTPGAVVLLAAANGAGFLAALVACRRAGLVPALCDSTAPAVERDRIARALGAAVEVVGDDAFPRDIGTIAVRATGATARAPLGDYVKITSGTSG
ncbi:MAG TPA: AMP-binding protein, partial [Candidatus Polarisedimenticolaceae bacterium]|nr:AMP-binding protein [Candidatus Polarisedimenticolaceae bacterium]